MADRGISAYVAIGRAKHPAEVSRTIKGPLTRAMAGRLKRAGEATRG